MENALVRHYPYFETADYADFKRRPRVARRKGMWDGRDTPARLLKSVGTSRCDVRD
jgi:hypothetical protein